MKILLITICRLASSLLRMQVGGAPDGNNLTTGGTAWWNSCQQRKKPIYDACHNRSRGTDMHKFREGLKCVLTDYSLLKWNEDRPRCYDNPALPHVSGKLGQAFTDCPKDDHNRNAAKGVKCIIDHWETDCPVPTGTTTR
uniref:Putative secreted protein n=1 Tax=Ixodes ricinus TaxID=34613 RepID=V5IC91_IXORI